MAEKAKRGPGRPKVAEKVVEGLEEAGLQAAADVAREATGLPPRPLTADEDFARTLQEQVYGQGRPVGFNGTADETAARLNVLDRLNAELPAEATQRYVYRRTGDRLEVWFR